MYEKLKKNQSLKSSNNSAMKTAARNARSGITGGGTTKSSISGLRNSNSLKEASTSKAKTALKTAAQSTAAKNRVARPLKKKEEVSKIAKSSKKTYNKK